MTRNDLDRAIRLQREGKWDRALAEYDRLLAADADNYNARGHRAWLLKGMGRYEEAADEYRRLVEMKPELSEARVILASVLHSLGKPQEAVSLLGEVLEREPFRLDALETWIRIARAHGSPPPRDRWDLDSQKGPSRPINPALEALETEPKNFPSSVYPSVGRTIYALVRMLRPEVVVETGCLIGYSSICIAQALEENDRGHLHSFDLFGPWEGYVSPIAGPCPDTLHAARAHLEAARLSHRVTLHKGDSSTGIRGLCETENKTIDLAFIDGDHSTRGCMKDFAAVARFLKVGGIVLMHDTMPDTADYIGPRFVLEHKCREVPGKFQTINLPSPERAGLGMVQKISDAKPEDWMPSLGILVKDWFLMKVERMRFWRRELNR